MPAHKTTSLLPLSLVWPDWRDTRDKHPLDRNLDRRWWHRHTSLKFFWPQPLPPWTTGSLARNLDWRWWHLHTSLKFFWPQPLASWTTGPFARNSDWRWWHRHTSLKCFWPQPLAPWTTGHTVLIVDLGKWATYQRHWIKCSDVVGERTLWVLWVEVPLLHQLEGDGVVVVPRHVHLLVFLPATEYDSVIVHRLS